MSIKEELINQGWKSKGIKKCDRCGETVEVLESEGGRRQYFNPSDHAYRPGMYHGFNCGLTLAAAAPVER